MAKCNYITKFDTIHFTYCFYRYFVKLYNSIHHTILWTCGTPLCCTL